MANAVQILIEAQNRARGELDRAAQQLRALGAEAETAGRKAKILEGNFANFGRQVSGALAQVNPAAAGVAMRFESIIASSRGLGAVGIAVAAVGAAAAAATLGAKSLADEIERLQRQATMTGVSANQLQILSHIIEQGGGSAEGLTQQLVFLNQQIGLGNPMLAKLAITTTDTGQAFMQLMRAVASSNDVQLQTLALRTLLGRSGADMIADAKAITDRYNEMAAAIRAANLEISPELTTRTEALDRKLDALKIRWDGWIRSLKESLLPIGEAAVDLVSLGTSINSLRPSGLLAPWFEHVGDRARAAASGFKAAVPPAKDLLEVLRETLTTVDRLSLAPRHAIAAAGRGAFAGRQEQRGPWDMDVGPMPLEDLRRGAAIEKLQAELQRTIEVHAKLRIKTVEEVRLSFMEINEFAFAASRGIVDGMTSIFQGFLDRSQTIGSAAITLWRSIVNAIMAELARLAAAQVLLFLARLLPAGSLSTSLLTIGQSMLDRPRKAAEPAGSPILRAGGGGNTYVIQAISSRDVLQDLTSATGSFRRANDRLAELGAA